MYSHDANNQNGTRRRRSTRNAAGNVNEPSMSPSMPMTGMNGVPGTDPVGYRSDWSQSYPAQPANGQAYSADWSQPYPAQTTGGQGYPAGSQSYPTGWTQQSYPVKPEGGQTGYGASGHQPFPPQTYQAPNQGWQQTYQPQSAYAPAANSPSDGGGSDGGGDGMKKLVILSCLVGILLGVAFWGLGRVGKNNGVNQAVSAYDHLFCEGVYVDGIHLGGMTQEEAAQAVTANAQQRLETWSIRLTYGEGEQETLVRRITAADMEMTVNVQEALEDAWEQGHSGTANDRKAQMDELLNKPYSGYTALPSGNTSVVDKLLDDFAAYVYREPKDAYVNGFDKAARSYPFDIVPEVVGCYLDVMPVKQQISAMVANMESGTIRMTPYVVYPAVTEQMLRSERTLLGTALTEISTTSTEGRTANIQRAFELIDGTILKPGDSFSFNGIVGARSAKNGFHLAIEYAYGQEREGYGGGVCQASTTVYLAAVRANMTITKREPHSDKVNYTDYGLDATVNIDGKKIDLTFKNTTNSNVYILSYLVRGNGRWNCKVDIYGPAHEEGVSYDLVAETVEILTAPTEPEYVEDKTGTHVVYIDEKPVVKRKASDGVIVETYKVKYLNGEEIERTFVARDTYKAKSQQLWVGVKDR